MCKTISLKKCLDLKIEGQVPSGSTPQKVDVSRCAICPDDFEGLVPKAEVREGDFVKVGSPLLRDKNHESVKIVSPMAGRIQAVVRGARRKIERIVIEADPATDPALALGFDRAGINTPEGALRLLCESGMMARMRQRPYDIVPDPSVRPRDIFVTAIDSAPLAADPTDHVAARELAEGVKLLQLLTDGKVYVSARPDSKIGDIPGAENVKVIGAHPAGLAGVQIANIAPVNKGETVWTLDVTTLYKIGRLALTGNVDPTTIVAVTGPEVVKPCLLATIEGAPIEALTVGNIADDGVHHRIISGNVLTGVAVGLDGYLRAPYRQITVIAEGDDVDEFMGWASLSPRKMSQSPSFPGRLLGRLFRPDARLLGGRRAMIMSGEYDRVMPMDILPEYLLKAIIGRDLERMEQLGIYEVAPEDFALAEYVDTSKQELQRIVRDGLDWLRKENS